ncbi:MAG: phosphoribosylglycinamide formyltransferase [Bdellovibrionales bacterium]|nr:phosphoribosylglycinamide formyltransferase [Bdellovibrionales bacterium]
MTTPLPQLVILASGSGSTFDYLLHSSLKGLLRAKIVSLVVNKPNTGAMSIALNHNIPAFEINKKNFSNESSWDLEMCQKVTPFQPDLIILAGFNQLLGPLFLAQFKGKVMNIHPSLLPHFGGKGMYGNHIHKAVIESKVKKSGITIHWVSEHYDDGPIIAQKEVLIENNETVSSLEQKIKLQEKQFYVEIINKILIK